MVLHQAGGYPRGTGNAADRRARKSVFGEVLERCVADSRTCREILESWPTARLVRRHPQKDTGV